MVPDIEGSADAAAFQGHNDWYLKRKEYYSKRAWQQSPSATPELAPPPLARHCPLSWATDQFFQRITPQSGNFLHRIAFSSCVGLTSIAECAQ